MRRTVWLTAGLLAVLSLASGMWTAAGEKGPPIWGWEPYSEGLPTYAITVAVASQPNDPTVIYVGTYEPPGLWRTDDSGRSWIRDDWGLEDSPVFALAWDASRRRWWAGTRDGLYTRQAVAAPWQAAWATGHAVYAIAEDGHGRLFLATEDGLLRQDGARGWAPITMPKTGMTALALDVSGDGQTLLAGTAGHGMWISADGGASWRPTPDPATPAGKELAEAIISAVQLPSRADGVAYSSTSERAYRSPDGGVTWLPIDGLAGRAYDFAPLTPGGIYAALVGQVARTSDDGRTWELHGTGLRADDRVFAVATSPADPACVCAAAWDGFYASPDGGQTWSRNSEGLGYPDVNSLAWDRAGNLLAGTRYGIYRSTHSRPSWEPILESDSPAVLTLSDAGNGRDFYAGLADGLARSTDGGQTWSEIASELTGNGIAGVVADPANPAHLHAWVAFGRIHESGDGGRNWTARWEGLGTVRPVTAIHRSGAGQLFVGAEDGLFRWERATETWQMLSLPLAAPTVFVVGSDARDEGAVYAGATDGLWRSANGGQDWERWGDGLAGKTVTALARSPTDAWVIFAGTRHAGLYVSGDGGMTWRPAWKGRMSRASVRDILFSPAGGEVFAASDQGIWRGYIDGLPG